MHSGHVPLAATGRKVDVVLTGEGCMSGSSDRRRTTESSQRWRVMALCIVSGFPSVDAMTGRSCWNVKAASKWAHAGVAVTIVMGVPRTMSCLRRPARLHTVRTMSFKE